MVNSPAKRKFLKIKEFLLHVKTGKEQKDKIKQYLQVRATHFGYLYFL